MHYALIPLLVGAISIPAVLARGRGEVCSFAGARWVTSAYPPPPSPTCLHVADPHGAMGLCPDLANHGWCDCGPEGDFPNLEGSNICGYTSLDPSAAIVLSTTNCVTSPTAQPNNVTVNSTPTPAVKRAEAHSRSSNLGRRANRLNRRQHFEDWQIRCSPGKDNADSGSPIIERAPQDQDYTDVDWPVSYFEMPSSSDVSAS